MRRERDERINHLEGPQRQPIVPTRVCHWVESSAVQPVAMGEVEAKMRLDASISGFADRVPLLSARRLVSRGQRYFLIGLLIVIVSALVADTRFTLTAIVAVLTLLYLTAVVYRAFLFTRSSMTNALEIVTDEEALRVPEAELPSYTILLPVYNEASVIIKLIENLAQVDYPADRLEVLLLVEEDDEETLGALRDSILLRNSSWW